MNSLNTTGKKRTFYGRRMGRALNEGRKQALKQLLPEYEIDAKAITEKSDLNPKKLFDGEYKKTVFEIGFGNGEHLASIVRNSPDTACIGAEPFINGMAALLKTLGEDKKEYKNLKLWMNDAMQVVKSLEKETIDTIYILNPDPWPKKRHHKRRIVNKKNLDEFARILKKGGKLITTTDVDELAEWMLTQIFVSGHFKWQAKKPEDWKTPPKGWQETRYEQKGKNAGRKQTYLLFENI